MASRKCSRVVWVDEVKNVENKWQNGEEQNKIKFSTSISNEAFWKMLTKQMSFRKWRNEKCICIFEKGKQFVIYDGMGSWWNEHWKLNIEQEHEHWLNVMKKKKLKRLLNCITWNQGFKRAEANRNGICCYWNKLKLHFNPIH